jgi:hypothetical protein
VHSGVVFDEAVHGGLRQLLSLHFYPTKLAFDYLNLPFIGQELTYFELQQQLSIFGRTSLEEIVNKEQ